MSAVLTTEEHMSRMTPLAKEAGAEIVCIAESSQEADETMVCAALRYNPPHMSRAYPMLPWHGMPCVHAIGAILLRRPPWSYLNLGVALPAMQQCFT